MVVKFVIKRRGEKLYITDQCHWEVTSDILKARMFETFLEAKEFICGDSSINIVRMVTIKVEKVE